jgi:predicted RND superfamily exporter protein
MILISGFYQRHSRLIVVGMFVSLAVLTPLAETIPPNNNTETWLSPDTDVRRVYDEYRAHFGGEELILVGIERDRHSDEFVEALCRRLERLDTVRQTWSPQRLTKVMVEFGLSADEITKRLKRTSISRDGRLAGVVVLLTDAGLEDRAATMQGVYDVLDRSQLTADQRRLTGAPVIVAELNRLGGRKANKIYFIFTIGICLSLLWYWIREFKTAFLILVETIWAFQLTLAVVKLTGGEMNFILGSLPVMVMVFTMAIAIHFLHHFAASMQSGDPIGKTLSEILWPCALATVTTAIGLASLSISEIPPVQQFGIATAGGTLAAFVAGIGITPAILTLCPPVHFRHASWHKLFRHLSAQLYVKRKRTTALLCGLVAYCGCGLYWVRAEFQPLNFLPASSTVLQDTQYLSREMAPTDSIEVIVDFGTRQRSRLEQVRIVREFERTLNDIPDVPAVTSGASFLPDPLPQDLAGLAALNISDANNYVADGGFKWRVSARIEPKGGVTRQDLFEAIQARSESVASRHDVSVVCTGISPLIERAQADIFTGFWKSVVSAFCLITVIMIISLWSFQAGAVAMLPNITPILLVFGVLGWLGIATDIGTMMTGSIALGIAVDGTFHFLTRYRRLFNETGNSVYATRVALEKTGPPIVHATLITGIGMLALALSNFGPTVRFGLLMTTSLAVALIGDLILLPCLLYLRPRSRKAPRRAGDQPQTDQQPLNDRETLFETSAAETIDESAARLPPRRPHVMRPKKQAPFVPGNSDIE